MVDAVDPNVDEARVRQKPRELLRRVDTDAIDQARPHRVRVGDLADRQERAAGLQHTQYLRERARQIGPEIQRFERRYRVEHTARIGDVVRAALTDQTAVSQLLAVERTAAAHAQLGNIHAVGLALRAAFEQAFEIHAAAAADVQRHGVRLPFMQPKPPFGDRRVAAVHAGEHQPAEQPLRAAEIFRPSHGNHLAFSVS